MSILSFSPSFSFVAILLFTYVCAAVFYVSSSSPLSLVFLFRCVTVTWSWVMQDGLLLTTGRHCVWITMKVTPPNMKKETKERNKKKGNTIISTFKLLAQIPSNCPYQTTTQDTQKKPPPSSQIKKIKKILKDRKKSSPNNSRVAVFLVKLLLHSHWPFLCRLLYCPWTKFSPVFCFSLPPPPHLFVFFFFSFSFWGVGGCIFPEMWHHSFLV